MADWVPIDDPNDPRLANTPLNEPQANAPQAPTIDFQPAAPASTGQEAIQFQPAADQAPAGPRGGDHRDLVTQSLLDHGVRPVAAAAILGDIQQESSFNPTLSDPHDPTGAYGLLQVGTPMFRQFNADQAAKGISPSDPEYTYNQAPFIIKKFAQQHPDRWDAMQNADSAPEALKIFRGTKDWGYGIAGKRYQYAQNYQQALSGVPVQNVDNYTRVEKAVPVTETEHQVARALPVNGARPPLPATDTLNAPPAPADQINFTPATAQQPQDGINFTPAQDVSAQAGETRVSQIASDLLQDPNAPPSPVTLTPPVPPPLVPGNIDLNNRPVVKNADGTVSTEKSFSIGTDQGEVLIPQVVGGKVVSKDQAIQHYKDTGEHLGIFETPEQADAYAGVVHQRLGTGQDWQSGYGVVKPLGLFQDPNESQNFLTPSQRQAVDTAGRYVQGAVGEAAKAALQANPATGIPIAIGRQFEQTRPIAEGIVEGTGKLAASQATLENVAIAAALGIPSIPAAASRVISAGFAAQMASQLPDVWKAFQEAPDLKSKVAVATEGIGQLALTAAATKHAVTDPRIPGVIYPGKGAGEPVVEGEGGTLGGPTDLSQIKVPGVGPPSGPIVEAGGAAAAAPQAPADLSEITVPGAAETQPVAAAPPTEVPAGAAPPAEPIVSPAAAEPEAPAVPTEPPGSAWTGIPFMSQDRVKTNLEQMGYTPDQIEGMTKSELAAIDWQGGTRAESAPEPAAEPAAAPVEPAPPTAKTPAPTGPVPGVVPAPPPGALGEPALPRDLTGAKPRYNYNLNSFQLKFESDLDKAAYISAQATRSKADARYVKFVADSTGLKEKEIRALGQQIRDRIKPMAKAASAQRAETGGARTLTVPRTSADFVQRKAAAEMVDARRTQVEAAGGVEDLFAPAAKPRAEGEPPTPIPAAPPKQTDFQFAKGEGSVAPGTKRRYVLPDEIRQRFQPRETTSPQFAVYRTRLEAESGGPVDEVHFPQVREVGYRGPRTSGERSIDTAHALADLYSDSLSWFRGRNGQRVPVRGFEYQGRIFLNTDMLEGPTGRPVHLIAAHEIAHGLEAHHPDLYYQLIEHAVTATGPRSDPYFWTLFHKGYEPEQANHELVADLVADTLADPARMRQALGGRPGVFEHLATVIRDFIDHSLRKLGVRKDASASGAVADLKAARADVMRVLKEARGRRAAGERAPPEARYSLDEPPTQAELEAAANDKEKMRGHIATIQRMKEVSPDVKAQVESYYTPTTLDAVNRAATEEINKLGLDQTNDKFMRNKTNDVANMARGHNVALRYDQLNRYDEAAAVREEMAKRLTNPAQTLWYVSTIGKTSPEGLIDTATKLVAGMVKPEAQPLLDQINRLRAEISSLKDEKAKAAAIQIVVRQMGKVKNPAQRLNPKQLEELLTRHAQGKLDENQLAATLAKYFKIPRLTPENINKIKAAQKAWANVPDDQPLLKQIRAADMMDSVYGLVPHTFWEKVRAASIISMIWHGKLPIRIGASSAIRLAGNTVVDGIMNFLPDVANVFSGRSTLTGGQVRGIVEGLYDPVRAYRAGYTDARIRGLAMTPSFKEGMHALITRSNLVNRGIMDVQSMRGGTHTFSSRFGRFMEDSLNILHNVVPLSFYDAAYRSSLYRQMRAARVATPTADMEFGAHVDANKVISNNPTAAYEMAKGIRKTLDLPTAGITKGKYGLGTALLPFALKPASLLTEGATWTPLGVGKAAYDILGPLYHSEPIRPREVGASLIKAALGTGLAVGAGYQLGKLGILTGAPDENKDLDAMRRASGMGAYKINVSELKRRLMSGNWWSVIPFTNTEGQRSHAQDGDYIINYNWLEPVAFPVAAGADLAQSEKDRVISLKKGRITPGAVASAGGAAVGSLTDAPMLQGVQQFATAIGEKDYMRAFVGLFANVPGNFVPALVRQTAQYMDNTVRETRGTFSGPITAGRVIDREASSILSQIPGLEARYPAKYDVFGEAVQRYNYGNNSLLNVFFNPAMVTRFKENPQLNEMERLYEGTGAGKGEPRAVPATLFINGKQVELTNEQIAAYQRYVGKESSAVITRLLASPKFAAEPMQQKQAVMSQVLSAVNTAAKIDLFGDAPVKVGMGTQGPTLSKPTPMDIVALIQARRSGLNRPDFVQQQPSNPRAPLWQLSPRPSLPSLAP